MERFTCVKKFAKENATVIAVAAGIGVFLAVLCVLVRKSLEEPGFYGDEDAELMTIKRECY